MPTIAKRLTYAAGVFASDQNAHHRVLSHNPIRTAASEQFSAITALAQSSPGRVSASAQALYACQEPDACFVRETRVMHRRRMSASVNY